MTTKAILFFLSFSCLFTVSSVYADSKDNSVVTQSNAGNDISFSDPQKTIIVKKGQAVFTVVLQSNPTAGFSWSLKSYDASLIKPISRTYFPTKKSLIGAGGYEKWVFAVKPPGFVVPYTTSITLIYARPSDLQGALATNFKVVTTP